MPIYSHMADIKHWTHSGTEYWNLGIFDICEEKELIDTLCDHARQLGLDSLLSYDFKITAKTEIGDEETYTHTYCGVYLVLKSGVMYVSTKAGLDRKITLAVLSIYPDLKLYSPGTFFKTPGANIIEYPIDDNRSCKYFLMRRCFREFLLTQGYCPQALARGGVISRQMLIYVLLLYFYSKHTFSVDGKDIDWNLFSYSNNRPIVNKLLLEHLIPDIQKSVNYEIVPIGESCKRYFIEVKDFLILTTCYIDYPECSVYDYHLPDYGITTSELEDIKDSLHSEMVLLQESK